MSNIGELPELKDELTRKTFEELENLIQRRESGKITNLEYRASINTLFAICSGLVDGDFFEMISEAAKETVEDHSFYERRLFQKDDKMAIVSRPVKTESFTLLVFNCNIANEKGFIGESKDDIDEKMETISSRLEKLGFEELI